jgi:hypothetical protein
MRLSTFRRIHPMKLPRLTILCLLGASLLPLAARADTKHYCTMPIAVAVAKSAGIPYNDADAATCKRAPDDPARTLAALAYPADGEDAKTLVVAVVDSRTTRVIRNYQVDVTEDAALMVGADSLALDTAPYRLAPGVRAFGLRFRSDARGASCADGIWRDELTLFVPDGARLRPVLKGLAMSRSWARKGCFGNGGDTLVYDEATLSIALAPTSTKGYADLEVSARIRRNGEGTAAVERLMLRYDGAEYRIGGKVPWWFVTMPLGQ